MTSIGAERQALADALTGNVTQGDEVIPVLPYFPSSPPYPPYITLDADDPFITNGVGGGMGKAHWIVFVAVDARNIELAQEQLDNICQQVINALRAAKYPVINVTAPEAVDYDGVPTSFVEIATQRNFYL